MAIIREITVAYWYLFDTWRYDAYQYYISIGVQPKNAFEKTLNKE